MVAVIEGDEGAEVLTKLLEGWASFLCFECIVGGIARSEAGTKLARLCIGDWKRVVDDDDQLGGASHQRKATSHSRWIDASGLVPDPPYRTILIQY